MRYVTLNYVDLGGNPKSEITGFYDLPRKGEGVDLGNATYKIVDITWRVVSGHTGDCLMPELTLVASR